MIGQVKILPSFLLKVNNSNREITKDLGAAKDSSRFVYFAMSAKITRSHKPHRTQAEREREG